MSYFKGNKNWGLALTWLQETFRELVNDMHHAQKLWVHAQSSQYTLAWDTGRRYCFCFIKTKINMYKLYSGTNTLTRQGRTKWSFGAICENIICDYGWCLLKNFQYGWRCKPNEYKGGRGPPAVHHPLPACFTGKCSRASSVPCLLDKGSPYTLCNRCSSVAELAQPVKNTWCLYIV